MRRFILILFVMLPVFLNAGIILRKSGEKIENVSIKSVTDTEIIYISVNGKETSISKNDVTAILYDDGRYEEINVSSQPEQDDGQKVFTAVASKTKQDSMSDKHELSQGDNGYNVLAYGVYALVYAKNTKYDGTTVEYRVIYKSKKEATEFKYLGTTPFICATDKFSSAANNFPSVISNVDAEYKGALVVENAKDVKYIEFRLSLDGYKTVVVKPIKDALLFNPVMYIPLQKLKRIKR